jgi:hypothetical protein
MTVSYLLFCVFCVFDQYINFNIGFPTREYKGTKSIIISTRTVVGGRNPFLGIAYVVVGGVCIILGTVFTVTHLIRPRFVSPSLSSSPVANSILENLVITLISRGTTPLAQSRAPAQPPLRVANFVLATLRQLATTPALFSELLQAHPLHLSDPHKVLQAATCTLLYQHRLSCTHLRGYETSIYMGW